MEKKYNTRNIYLIGLMGSGKTTIGRSLANRLGLGFIDSDREIEARTGVNIPTIFELEGEDGFRTREAQVIADVSLLNDQVVATGGGAILRPENRGSMCKSGFIVYLNVPPYKLWERTRHDRNRPLLQVANPLLKLEELYAQRDPLYREIADLIIDGGRMSARSVLQYLIKEIKARWKL